MVDKTYNKNYNKTRIEKKNYMISRNLEWSCQQNSGIELWQVNIILERKNEHKK